MKKKLLAGLMVLALACLALPGALAQGNSYTLTDEGITITLPEDMVIFGPGVVPAISLAAELGVTVQDVEDMYEEMEKAGFRLSAIDMDQGYELDLSAEKTDLVTDLREWGESQQEEIYRAGETEGIYWEGISGYSHEQAQFIRATTIRDDGVGIVRYLTIYDNWILRFSVLNYEGPVTQKQEQILQEVVDTVHFDRESIYTPASVFEKTGGMVLFMNMLVTLAVYCLPLIIYRFGVRRAPVERKKARKIVVIYGIGAYLCMSVMMFMAWEGEKIANTAAAFLWCWVDYLFLTKGSKKKIELTQTSGPDLAAGTVPNPVPAAPVEQEGRGYTDEKMSELRKEAGNCGPEATRGGSACESVQVPDSEPISAQGPVPHEETIAADKVQQEPSDQKEDIPILFCRYCGARLQEDSIFCHQCGARVRDQ